MLKYINEGKRGIKCTLCEDLKEGGKLTPYIRRCIEWYKNKKFNNKNIYISIYKNIEKRGENKFPIKIADMSLYIFETCCRVEFKKKYKLVMKGLWVACWLIFSILLSELWNLMLWIYFKIYVC